MTVRVAAEAERHIEAIDAWWRAHRPAAPDLFADELDLLGRIPAMGRIWPQSAIEGVRRLVLRATRYHVYQATHGDGVVVLAVWSAVRETGPELQAGPTHTAHGAAICLARPV